LLVEPITLVFEDPDENAGREIDILWITSPETGSAKYFGQDFIEVKTESLII
jgi:hypothetical protein